MKDHKTKKSKREIPVSICDHGKCKFFGKPAAQGVCFSALNDPTVKYVKSVSKHGENLLKEIKAGWLANNKSKSKSKDSLVKYLEGYIVVTWMNYVFSLDELVHLRAENAKLRLELGKYDKKGI